MGRTTSILDMSVDEIAERLATGDRVILGKAITLVESKLKAHQNKGDELLVKLLRQKNDSFRIAISGSPGVGKSTWIEELGSYLAENGHKVAVLSIDPSSEINRGSILGDKTRMEKLSIHDNAFIRPSPAGDFLGGIAWRTREAITICEAAGYDIIFIETVGVGQSEYKVHSMVDCFFLLLSPGGGDELQGIKRGIVEIADILAVAKCDGAMTAQAMKTRKDYAQALHLYKSKEHNWTPKVLTVSSLTGKGIEEAWAAIQSYKTLIEENGFFKDNRNRQNLNWFKERLASGIQQYIDGQILRKDENVIESKIISGEIDPISSAASVLSKIIES